MTAYPEILIGASTGYIGNSGDTWLMCLYSNDASKGYNKGVIKLIGSKYDSSKNTCYQDTSNQLITCVSETNYGLKNLGRVLVRLNSFNYGCIESFGCSSGEDCTNKSCSTFGNRTSIDSNIPIRASNNTSPDSVKSIVIVPGDSQIKVSWESVTDPTGGEVFAYYVRILDSSGNIVVTGYKEAGARNVTIGRLVNGNTYGIELIAISHNGINSGSSTVYAVPIGTTMVGIDPSSVAVDFSSGSITMDIAINPKGNKVSAGQFDLSFDPSILEITNIKEGNFLKQTGASTIFDPGTIDNKKGFVNNVYCVITTPGNYVTTKGTFTILTIKLKAGGTSKLNLSNVIMSTPDSKALKLVITNGSVLVKAPNITATDMKITISNSTASVNIMWSNKGSTTGKFTPGLTLDGLHKDNGELVTLDPNKTMFRTFKLTSLLSGNHIICPDPN